MAVYRIFPEKTATLYSEYADMNTGRDEILEIASYYKGDVSYVNRALIQFDTAEVSNVLETYVSSSTRAVTDFSASLKLYLATANEVPDSYTVEAWPLYVNGATSWTAGNGKYGDLPRNSSGASWFFSQASSSAWSTTTYVTQSYSSSFIGGGSWYTASANFTFAMSQSHTVVSTHDLNLNITNGVIAHYTGSAGGGVSNAGYVLKLSKPTEFQTSRQMYLRYFSGQTHTIYPPCLEIKWDDSEYNTTLSLLTDSNGIIKVKNNRGEYVDEGKQRFEIFARPKYPPRTFATSSTYLTTYRLPANTYWGLRDENTEEMVIDFDTTFTKVSASPSSSYFDVYMGGLEPERYYRVLLKSTINGSTVVLDNDILFKVVRNG